MSCLLAGGLPACDIGQGERSETGECPPGEICSPHTPDGLIFEGPSDGSGFRLDDPLPRLAAGGRMTVSVHRSNYHQLPPFDVAVEDALLLSAIQEPTKNIRLLGHAAGVTKLRVLEAGTQQLLDRHSVVVEEVESVVLVGCSGASGDAATPDSAGLWAGVGTTEISVQLRGFAGSYLVDEDIVFDPPAKSLGFSGWNRRIYDVPKSGNLTVRATSGGQAAIIEIPTFQARDGLRTHWYRLAEPREALALDGAELPLGELPVICGQGTAGGRTLCNAPASVEVIQNGKSVGIAVGCGYFGEPDVAPGPALVRIGESTSADDGSIHVVGETYSITFVP